MKQQLNLFEPISRQVKNADGNTKMVNYGIQNDQSNYRVHVGYVAQHIFVFPTQAGRDALERERDRLVLKIGGQQGVSGVTFRGYPIPISSIDNIQSILIPMDIWQKHKIHKDQQTTTKGLLAVQIVVEMLKRHLIKLPLDISTVDDKALQIKGTDIIISTRLHIQVKCDFKAGERKNSGTGNLFLQVAECNPRGMR